MFSARHAVAPQRPGSKRIENVITTVFISKRTAGSLLLSIWKDPDGYSWSSLPGEQPCLKLLVQLPLNLPPPFFLLRWLLLLYAKCLKFVFVSTKEGKEPSFLCVALPCRPASGYLDKTQEFEVLVTHDCCHSVLINLIVLYKTIQLTGSNHSSWQGLSGVVGHWWQAQELIAWCTHCFLALLAGCLGLV